MAESLHTVSSLPCTYVSDADRFRPGESVVGKTVETGGETWSVVGVVVTVK